MKPGTSTADICCSVLDSSVCFPGFAFIPTIDLIAILSTSTAPKQRPLEGLAGYLTLIRSPLLRTPTDDFGAGEIPEAVPRQSGDPGCCRRAIRGN
jgi:hypothetical protein